MQKEEFLKLKENENLNINCVLLIELRLKRRTAQLICLFCFHFCENGLFPKFPFITVFFVIKFNLFITYALSKGRKTKLEA